MNCEMSVVKSVYSSPFTARSSSCPYICIKLYLHYIVLFGKMIARKKSHTHLKKKKNNNNKTVIYFTAFCCHKCCLDYRQELLFVHTSCWEIKLKKFILWKKVNSLNHEHICICIHAVLYAL